MRRATWIALLALAGLAPESAPAQGVAPDPVRRIAVLMDRFREQMWSYRQDLDYFQKAPEYNKLVELRFHLRNKAIAVTDLSKGGPDTFPDQFKLAKEMDITVREMFRLTRQLEYGVLAAGAGDDARRRAQMLTDRTADLRVLIGRWQEAIGMEFEAFGVDPGALDDPGPNDAPPPQGPAVAPPQAPAVAPPPPPPGDVPPPPPVPYVPPGRQDGR